MLKSLFITFLVGFSIFVSAQEREVKVFEDFMEFEKKILDPGDQKTHFINFWATWCKPCVAELPMIDALTEKYGDNIKVTLVSLDFPDKLKTKLIPFVNTHKLKSEVVLLADGNANFWIPKVDPDWSGAIPASVVFYKGKKYFFEQQFHAAEELENIISKIHQQN